MIDLKEVPARATSVTRWTGVPLIHHRNTLAEHSFAVSYYALLIYQQCNLRNFVDKGDLLHYCMIHDIPEIVTADIPANVKKLVPEIKSLLNKVEDMIYNEHLAEVNIEPTPTIKFITKAADYIAILVEYNAEILAGNKSSTLLDAGPVIGVIYDALNTAHPEADVFVHELVMCFIKDNFSRVL
ncbi:HD domain-containing protein [Ralstonia phage RP13]|nr:HD domain-containing protein [Ralstonia phage RP13]